MTSAEIRSAVELQGWACGFCSVGRLAALRADARRMAPGGVDPDVMRERLGFYEFQPPASLPGARALIVAAVPLPCVRVRFAWNGAPVEVMVPPAYVGYEAAGRRVQAFLQGLLTPLGRRLETVQLPEKLLAARIGLALYGRNNLVYVPGMGSYLRLVTFYTDLELTEDGWQEPRELPRCASCEACRKTCPTGAIPADRFLLRAERCLVFHNERPSGIPFPAWIPAGAHGCLVGCLKCQAPCPENTHYRGCIEDGGEFTGEETSCLLSGQPLESLDPRLRAKLDRSDLTPAYGMLARNLRALLSAGGTPAGGSSAGVPRRG